MLRKMNCCQQLSEILKRLDMTQTIELSVMEMDDRAVEKECDTEQRHDKTVWLQLFVICNYAPCSGDECLATNV